MTNGSTPPKKPQTVDDRAKDRLRKAATAQQSDKDLLLAVDDKILASLSPVYRQLEALDQSCVAIRREAKDYSDGVKTDLTTEFEAARRVDELKFSETVRDFELCFQRLKTWLDSHEAKLMGHASELLTRKEISEQILDNLKAMSTAGSALSQQVNDLRDEMESMRGMQELLEARTDKAVEHSFSATKSMADLGKRVVLKGSPDWWTVGINAVAISVVVYLFDTFFAR